MYVHVNIVLGFPIASETTPAAILIVEEGVDPRLGTLDHLPKLPEGIGNIGTIGTADWHRDRDGRRKVKIDRSTVKTVWTVINSIKINCIMLTIFVSC